jgi:PAS domain S-box-containing protein
MALLLRQVNALANGEPRLDRPPPATALREFGELFGSFQRMARQLAERAVQRDGAIGEMTHQKNMLQSVLESMAEGVIVLDPGGRLLHVNEAAGRILPGLRAFVRPEPSADPGVPRGFHTIDGAPCAPADLPSARALRGEAVESFQLRVRGEPGRGDKVLQGSARPVLLGADARNGAVVVFSDHTEAWAAQERLKDSELRYRTLFQANPHPMWVFDAKTLRFLTVNDAAIARYGYSRAEFLAMTIDQIRPPEDVARLHASLDEIVPPLTPRRAWRHRLKDGTVIQVEITSHALEYEGRPAWLVLAHDITARVEAEAALLQLTESLERRVQDRTRELALANRELESFSYSVSHDLRAPLQVIDGFGQALQNRHRAQLQPQAQHYLERIRENTRQMGQLIDDLLALARVTRAVIVPEPIDLAPRAHHVVERLRQRWPERQVVVQIDEPMLCSGDPQLLGIVLENLIGNAWKFTSRTPQARIHVGLRIDEEGPVYFVSDNGAGFDMTYADKLFKAFQRLHATTEFEGTGVGLATVHRIVTRHGGRVWAESVPGERTTFHFTLYEGGAHEEQPHPAGRGQPGPPGTDADDPGGEQRPQ